tara:strand:- start:541 stop:900 length:360 start_codon:yes stop_codon:yes gene_type:complete
MFSSIINIGKKAIGAASSFFKSDTFDTARTIASGAGTVINAMRDAAGRTDLSQPPQGLVNPRQDFSQFRDRGTSRSRAGRPGFSDIGEATYTKYAQLQNTVRYLYGEKSRYKSITKSRT